VGAWGLVWGFGLGFGWVLVFVCVCCCKHVLLVCFLCCWCCVALFVGFVLVIGDGVIVCGFLFLLLGIVCLCVEGFKYCCKHV